MKRFKDSFTELCSVYFSFKITAGKSLENSGHQLGQGKELKFTRITDE